ncbi:hypothetical protein NUACC26_016880 [Scytonema sp. NUACC26]
MRSVELTLNLGSERAAQKLSIKEKFFKYHISQETRTGII